MQATLRLDALKCLVRLGWGEEERSVPQSVHFWLQIRFAPGSVPAACRSDDLNGTICYASLSDRLVRLCADREFRLIEHLGWAAFETLKPLLPDGALLWLRVQKDKPPIADLEGGASFSVGEWEQTAG